MALKIRNAPAVVTPAPTDEYATAQGGVSRRTTRLQMFTAESGEQFLADDGITTAPGFSFVSAPNMGFWVNLINQTSWSTLGIERYRFANEDFGGVAANSGVLSRNGASATFSVFQARGDPDTGPLGRRAADEGTLVAGAVEVAAYVEAAGVVQFILPSQNNIATPSLAIGDGDSGLLETADDVCVLASLAQNCMEWSGIGAVPLIAFYGTGAIALQTGVAVTAAGVHAALVNLGLITA